MDVAPLAGAWIEITINILTDDDNKVAPLAGAWIEIVLKYPFPLPGVSRSPCGSVD